MSRTPLPSPRPLSPVAVGSHRCPLHGCTAAAQRSAAPSACHPALSIRGAPLANTRANVTAGMQTTSESTMCSVPSCASSPTRSSSSSSRSTSPARLPSSPTAYEQLAYKRGRLGYATSSSASTMSPWPWRSSSSTCAKSPSTALCWYAFDDTLACRPLRAC